MYEDRLRKLVKKSEGLLVRKPGNEIGHMKREEMGALNSINDEKGTKRKEHAEKYYAFIRNSDRNLNIKAMVENTGVDKEIVESAYSHVFETKHNLSAGYTYFDPSYDMAQSWQRMRNGTGIRPYDIILLKHENLESKIWKEHPTWTYDQAHAEANKTYDYWSAKMEWEMEHKK